MSEYVIITDSSADLSEEQVRDMGVTVLPLNFIIRGKPYRDTPDHGDMSIENFYELIRNGEPSSTNAVNMSGFEEVMLRLLKAGKDILVLAFSSGLSATYQAATMAAKEMKELFPGRKVEVVDTLCASMGEGLLVWYAANMQKEGKSLEEVRDWCEDNKLKVCHWFTVDDLMHLKRGGRVSGTTALMGTLLQIKPVLHVDDAGHLINMAKARGRKASLDALVNKVGETCIDPASQTMFISHSSCREDAEYVAEQIKTKYGAKEIVIGNIGPVIGSHTGCGCVALFYIGSKR